MFDAPGSQRSAITGLLFAAFLIYPIPAIIGNVMFWRAFKEKSKRKSFLFFLLSASGYLAALCLLIALELVCDGKFACG